MFKRIKDCIGHTFMYTIIKKEGKTINSINNVFKPKKKKIPRKSMQN